MAEARHDAIIVGAGPAGAAAALLLARAGWDVAIVEKSSFPRRKVCGEFISATTMPLLYALNVAQAFLAQAGPPVRRVGLYEGETAVDALMPAPETGNAGWGRALGREHLDTILLRAAVRAGAELWQPWRAVQLARDDAG